MGLKLYGIAYSPWTARARWSLDHHGIDYRYREYVPYLGEPYLRALYRDVPGKPTVPLLKGDGVGVGDSWEIAVWADENGDGPSLRTSEAEVRAFCESVEPAFEALRVRVTRRTLTDKRALTEAATAAAPQFAAGLFRPVAAAGARHIASKYAFDADGDSGNQPDEVVGAFERIRGVLDGKEYVVGGSFSAADIFAATLVHGIQPCATYPGLGPETRRIWTDEELRKRFPDLLAWRDDMISKHWSGGPHA